MTPDPKRMERTTFMPIQRSTVAENVIDQVKTLMRTDRYGANSELPSERDLARQVGASRHSVRVALQALALLGLLDVRHGSGTRVASSSSNLFKVPFEFLMLFDRPSMPELLETREVLEVFLAGRAAKRRTAKDLAAMEAALDEMRDHLGDPKGMIAADVRFHEALAAAGHNRILERVITSLHEPLYAFMEATLPGVRDPGRLPQDHRDIFEAIRRRDAEGARQAMSKTMEETKEELRRVRRTR